MKKHFYLFLFIGYVSQTSLLLADAAKTTSGKPISREITSTELSTPEDKSSGILIPAFDAHYELHRKGDKVGKVQRKLISTGDNSWQFTMKSKGGVFFISADYYQESHFSWKDGIPRPENYLQSYSTSFKSAKSNKQLFDWEKMLETGSYHKKKWQLKLTHGIQDRLTSIILLRSDLLRLDQQQGKSQTTFQYPVSYKGKIKNDVYELIGEEKITTPAGEFDALYVKKIHQNKSRVSYVWLVKELSYLPVRIKQFKKEKEQADMILKSVIMH